MLVLTRGVGETIKIGTDITITVCLIQGRDRRVRIGIDAPRELEVHRGEVAARIETGKKEGKTDE